MKVKSLTIPRECNLCYNFNPFEEWEEKHILNCAENFLDGKNCPNWVPVKIRTSKKKWRYFLK